MTTIASGFASICLALVAVGNWSCRTCKQPKERTAAEAMELGKIQHDRIDGSTCKLVDWRVFAITDPSNIRVDLNWDEVTSRLELGIYDGMGRRIDLPSEKIGRTGLRLETAPLPKGEYYIRVASTNNDSVSPYSIMAEAVRTQKPVCHQCKVGDAICLGSDACALCGEISEGCAAWSTILTCEAGQRCWGGRCVEGCQNECEEGERRCSGARYQTCVLSDEGCRRWEQSRACGTNQKCEAGRCVKGEVAPVASAAPREVDLEIVRIYSDRVTNTYMLDLYIKDINPLHIRGGYVLKPGTNARLEGSEFEGIASHSGQKVRVRVQVSSIGNAKKARVRLAE